MDLQKNWIIMIGTCSMILLVNLDMTIINLALPVITKTLHAPLTKTQWIISIYLFAATIFFVVCGRLADKFGKKTLFLIGSLCFLTSSVVLSFSNNFSIILVMRFIQGIGFATTLNLALLINTEIFPSNKRGLALGISITLSGIGQAFGPTLAGIILSISSWHWLFTINIPFCFIAIFCAAMFYQEKNTQKIDLKIFDMGVFNISNYNTIVYVRTIFMFCWGVMLFCLPIYLQNYLGFTPLRSGYIIFSMTAILGICSFMIGKALDRIGSERPIIISLVCAIISFMLLIFSIYYHLIHLFFLSLVLCGFNAGIMIPSSVFAAMHSLPLEQKGFGMGVFFTLSFLSAALGVSLSSYLLVNLISIADGFIFITIIMLAATIGALLLFLKTQQILK